MQLSNAVRVGLWALIGLNLLMAFGAIAVFVRMTPAIALIIERNERSLEAGEEMLASLALSHAEQHVSQATRYRFDAAYRRAEGNVTEPGEPQALETIARYHVDAFNGNQAANRMTVDAISELTRINRRAMREADERAQQLGNAGAWGVVFMALWILAVTLVFLRSIRRWVIEPLAEIHDVLVVHRGKDRFRRCGGGTSPSREVKAVYAKINELLDTRLTEPDCLPHPADPSHP